MRWILFFEAVVLLSLAKASSLFIKCIVILALLAMHASLSLRIH